MLFGNIWFALIGLLGLLCWSTLFWKQFKRSTFVLTDYQKNGRQFLKGFVYFWGLVGWLSLSIALTLPKLKKTEHFSERKVNDLYIVFDVSRSMGANDFVPNRLEEAKKKINQFLAMRIQDRIGIIAFSEKVLTILPLSLDLQLVKKSISEVKMGPLGSGTNIGGALGLAVGRLIHSEAKKKVIILLTDGVDNVGKSGPFEASKLAKRLGIRIYTIGIGGNKDARLPYRDKFGGEVRFQKIPGGSFDEKLLKEIAFMTQGKFYSAKSGHILEEVLSEIDKLERTAIKTHFHYAFKEIYWYFALLGISLLVISELGKRFILREVL